MLNKMTEIKFKPMLAGTIKTTDDLAKLNYPMLASPKLDGIRALVLYEKGLVTRSLKKIPNKATQTFFLELLRQFPEIAGLDGEILAGSVGDMCDPHIFNRTTRAVMSHAGSPKLTYAIFDKYIPDTTYNMRAIGLARELIPKLNSWVASHANSTKLQVDFIFLQSKFCAKPQEVLAYETHCLLRGYEGVMLRDTCKPYKCGRSAITKTQQHLLKLKRFADAEAEVIGFEELKHNNNEATVDNLGHTERSSHQENMVGGQTLGSLLVCGVNGDYTGCTFKIGTGFDAVLRNRLWKKQGLYMGRLLTYKYQECGSLEAPRFPVFRTFREAE